MISQRICLRSLILASLVVLAACGGGVTADPPTATSAPAAPPTATPAPPTPTSAPPTATRVTEKVTFEYIDQLQTLEQVDSIIAPLEEVEGVISASGSEVFITIRYDPEILTVEDLQATMTRIGRPVKK